MNKKLEKYFEAKLKELNENPIIFQNNHYGKHLRETLDKLAEDD